MNKAPARIACLGWGSLIKTPGDLPVTGGWHDDGPMLPVEFARESADGRMTLVLCEGVQSVPTCWALLDVPGISDAIGALAKREGISKRVATDIGFFDAGLATRSGMNADEITAWAGQHDFDGVVWTNLPCGFKNARGVMPSFDAVLAHLCGLKPEVLANARAYIEQAPNRLDTSYRRAISKKLGWTPAE